MARLRCAAPTANRRRARQQDRRDAEPRGEMRRAVSSPTTKPHQRPSFGIALDGEAGRRIAAGEPADARRRLGLRPRRAGRRQGIERPAQKMRQAAQRRGGGEAVERGAATIVGMSSHSASLGAHWTTASTPRASISVSRSAASLSMSALLGIDQQPARQRLALPARQVGRVAVAGDLQPRLVVGKTAQPVALAQQQFAAAQAQMRVVGPVGQRHVEIGQRAHPVAARRQQAGARATATASGDGRSTAPRHRRARPRRGGPAPRARGPCCGRWRHRRASGARRDRAPPARRHARPAPRGSRRD